MPSSGVGTGYRREALEKLARASSNRIFEPEALDRGLRKWPAPVSAWMLADVRSVWRGVELARLRGHARIFSRRLERRAAAANALGHGHRAARLAAIRMARNSRRGVLAVARPQGTDRQSAELARERHFPLRPGDFAVDPRESG